jgi:hypothetical protein
MCRAASPPQVPVWTQPELPDIQLADEQNRAARPLLKTWFDRPIS